MLRIFNSIHGNGIKIDSQIDDNYPFRFKTNKIYFRVDIRYISVLYLRNRKHIPCFYRVIETRGRQGFL